LIEKPSRELLLELSVFEKHDIVSEELDSATHEQLNLF